MPASAEFFARHRHRVFVETGTYEGEGVRQALAAGFEEIFSVELSETLFSQNSAEFAGQPGVHLFCGSSDDQLWNMIKNLREPAAFWLDAHYSGGSTVKGKQMSPILAEIRAIAEHPIKTHTIMIDDRRDFGTANFSYVTEAQIRDALLAINPGYRITCQTGTAIHPLFKDDVLVAEVEKPA